MRLKQIFNEANTPAGMSEGSFVIHISLNSVGLTSENMDLRPTSSQMFK